MLNKNPNSRPNSPYLREKFESFKRENEKKFKDLSSSNSDADFIIAKSKIHLRK